MTHYHLRKPYKFKNKDPNLTHLMFVDDVLPFGKANRKNIQDIHNVTNDFCFASGYGNKPGKSQRFGSHKQ